jgi:hypothetical protein
VLATLLAIAVLAAPTQKPLVVRLATSIDSRLPSRWSITRRATYSKKLAQRIVIEAHRRKIDPLALAAIGWIESGWQSWRTRQDGRYRSVGVWQLIAVDSGPAMARKLLARELIPAIVKARTRRPGAWFSETELRDLTVGTYVAAVEISKHRQNCIKRRHKPHLWPGCRLSPSVQAHLGRLAHYNTGTKKPTRLYLRRLCKRYGILAKEQGQ